MALTEHKLKALEPMPRAYKVYDTGGLFALVQPSGAIWWRLRYRLGGKEKGLSLGVYDAVSLVKAREARDKALEQIAEGKDPSELRQLERAQPIEPKLSRSNTFIQIGQEWLALRSMAWSQKTIKKKTWLLNSFIYPYIIEYQPNPTDAVRKVAFGDMPVDQIQSQHAFAVIKAVEAAGKIDTAHSVKDVIAHVLRYARPKGLKTINVQDDMRGAMAVTKTKHHPAITKPDQLGELLRVIYAYRGRPATNAAFKLSPMLFPRPENLREMEWTELSLDEAVWTIPAAKMKGAEITDKQDHIVPLPLQAVDILRGLQPITGDCRYVFPNDRGCVYPMSENA
jgi:integrase